MSIDAAEHRRIKPTTPSDYLAVMSRAVFQAGLSWAAIDERWPDLMKAFLGFDAQKVAQFDEGDVDDLMAYPGIIHSQKKILGTIHNAQTLLSLDQEFGGVRTYLRSLKSYDDLVADMKKRFKFVGELSAYYFLYRVGEKVPPYEKWITTVDGDHPRIREMVTE